MTDIKALAVQTDTALADLYAKRERAMQRVSDFADGIHRAAGDRRRGGWRGPWEMTLEEACRAAAETGPRWLDDYAAAKGVVADLDALIEPLVAVYRQHRWQRAYLVVSSDGHVHSSTACSTCRPSTVFAWRTEYSGSSEQDIVEAAGELACTVCYPSAPVDVLQRPSAFTREEREAAEQAKAERAAAKAERDAKRRAAAPTKSGEPLVVETPDSRWPEVFQTERTALSWVVDKLVWAEYAGGSGLDPIYDNAMDAILEAVAEKRGVTADEVLAEVQAKAAKKYKTEQRGL